MNNYGDRLTSYKKIRQVWIINPKTQIKNIKKGKNKEKQKLKKELENEY